MDIQNVYPLLILMAAGYLGFRKSYKQEDSWEKLIQTYAVRISELRSDHRECEERYDKLEERCGQLETQVGHLNNLTNLQVREIDALRLKLEMKDK